MEIAQVGEWLRRFNVRPCRFSQAGDGRCAHAHALCIDEGVSPAAAIDVERQQVDAVAAHVGGDDVVRIEAGTGIQQRGVERRWAALFQPAGNV